MQDRDASGGVYTLSRACMHKPHPEGAGVKKGCVLREGGGGGGGGGL